MSPVSRYQSQANPPVSVVSNSDRALAFNTNGTSSSAIARATREQMSEARLPLPYRDSCAHLLIPLNRCRFEEFYMPWKCVVRIAVLAPLKWSGCLLTTDARMRDTRTRSVSIWNLRRG